MISVFWNQINYWFHVQELKKSSKFGMKQPNHSFMNLFLKETDLENLQLILLNQYLLQDIKVDLFVYLMQLLINQSLKLLSTSPQFEM